MPIHCAMWCHHWRVFLWHGSWVQMGLTHVMCLHLCVYRVWIEWLLYDATMTNSSGVSFHISSLLWLNAEGTSKNICHRFIINERYKFTKHAYAMGYPMSQAHMGQAHMCPAPMAQENPPWFVLIMWVILIKVFLQVYVYVYVYVYIYVCACACVCVCLCLCLCKVKSTQGEPGGITSICPFVHSFLAHPLIMFMFMFMCMCMCMFMFMFM